MRHAQSKANLRGIIVSRIENDRHGDYGLTGLAARLGAWRQSRVCPGWDCWAGSWPGCDGSAACAA